MAKYISKLINGEELYYLKDDEARANKADKASTVSTISYDTTNKKLTKTINETTSDVVTAADIIADGGVSQMINNAKSEIKGTATSACDTLGDAETLISAELTRAQTAESALNSGKADKATTLAGYGIADAYTKSETYTKTEVNGLVDSPHLEYVTVDAYANLPATGSKDTIYRVSNYNGSTSLVDASVYSEYAWNGSQYIFLCVKSQIGEVFDISVYNNNAKYADLAAALNGGANIPQSLQKGGMSVKFVQSSDNKYVQYRLMSDTFSTIVTDWQGDCLSEFNGYHNYISENDYVNLVDNSRNIAGKDINSSNGSIVDAQDSFISDKIYADFTKKIIIGNTYNTYAYCYSETGYLGRVNCSSAIVLKTEKPDVTYIRVLGKLKEVNTITVRHADGGFCPAGFKVFVNNNEQIQEIDSAGNLYNKKLALDNIDIRTATGEFLYDSTSRCTHAIAVDPTRSICAVGFFYSYFYCYDANLAYLGRIVLPRSLVCKIADTYPTCKYIFLLTKKSHVTVTETVCYSDTLISSNTPILKKENEYAKRVVIETYNVGDYSGIGTPSVYDYRNAIAEGNADIICFQEDVAQAFGGEPSETVFGEYAFVQRINGGNYNCFSIASKYAQISKASVEYTHGQATNPYNHPFFQFATILIDNKVVAFANVHLDWQDNGWRRLQLRQVINYLSNYDYAIVVGDFNPDNYDHGTKIDDTLVYEEDWQYFDEAGYKRGNAGYFGTFRTTGLSNPDGPYDNIFVKGNISIQKAYVRKKDYMNDHLIFGCCLTIY